MSKSLPILCLMGQTASGKTALALELVERFPCDIISVDSAMVYRGMDIGTAKPSADILAAIPHRLIDICDPSQPYSAGQFHQDALFHIDDILAKGRIPLLVGGTMLYFRLLQQGLAWLPKADPQLRQQWQARLEACGSEALHAELLAVDPIAAKRIHHQDSQRIQRALEVFTLTGKTLTAWQQEGTHPLTGYQLCFLALQPPDRAILHSQISLRFDLMLKRGFVEEVKVLYERGDLTADLPAMRSVGYAQVWAYLSEQLSYSEMCEKALIATRQLAKRQLTWLRSWPELTWLQGGSKDVFDEISRRLTTFSTL